MSSGLLARKTHTDVRRIIAFAGAKQSGKNAAANFCGATLLYSYYFIDGFRLAHEGLYVTRNSKEELVDLNTVAPDFLKVYHWADELKITISRLFNIDINLLYGTDSDKDTKTPYKWEDMPGVVTNQKMYGYLMKGAKKKIDLLGKEYGVSPPNIMFHEPGNMTIREILQYFGTDVCRSIYNNCWVSSLESRIKSETPAVALIADTRFDNELFAVKEWGGLCIKMDRKTKEDSHVSENGIREFSDWDAVIKNQNTNTIPEMHKLFLETLRPVGVFEEL